MSLLKTEKREIFGKKLKESRGKGKLPGIVYGQGIQEPIPVFVVKEEFKKVFKQAHETDFIDLAFGDDKKSVLVKDIETDPVSDEPIHIDFFAPRLDKPIEAKIPLVFAGESPAIKLGGVLVKVMREISVKGLPKEIPHQIEVDLSLLKNLEDRVTINDIKFPSGVEPLAKKEETVILATLPKKEEVIVPEAAPSLEDIEVIKKGKKEEEAEGEEAEAKETPKGKEDKKKEEKKEK